MISYNTNLLKMRTEFTVWLQFLTLRELKTKVSRLKELLSQQGISPQFLR